MLAPLFFLVLPVLLSALPASPRFTPNAAADALTLKQMATEKRLIKVGENTPAQWMTDAQIGELTRQKAHFMDITFTPNLEAGEAFTVKDSFDGAIPTAPTQQAIVNPIIAKANTDLMKSTLETLSGFNNRYYKSSTGEQSSNWLFGKVQEVVAQSNTKLTVTVTQFKHTSWNQSSIIAHIDGQNGNQETVIVGAHQDSINMFDRMAGRAPGSDDDGSGSVTILEAFRLLLNSDYVPLRPVEFQWYSGEEAGLLGSQAIAQQYKKDGRTVAGMLQLDMTMYPTKSNPDVGIVTDYTDSSLNTLTRSLVTAYTTLKPKDFKCGYGCSDHASWNRAGYPSTIPFESSNMHENSKIHTPNDDLTTVNYDHGLHFAKIAVGFVVEMSHS